MMLMLWLPTMAPCIGTARLPEDVTKRRLSFKRVSGRFLLVMQYGPDIHVILGSWIVQKRVFLFQSCSDGVSLRVGEGVAFTARR